MTDELRIIVAINLRTARWNHEWSQEFVSKQTGLSVRTISRAETGRGLSAKTLKRLCAFYGVSLASIYLDRRNAVQAHVEPIPFNTVVNILSKSSFINDIQHEAVLQFNNSIQKNAVMCRAQVEDILPEVIRRKSSYTISEIIQCCIEVNRRTIQSISDMAIA